MTTPPPRPPPPLSSSLAPPLPPPTPPPRRYVLTVPTVPTVPTEALPQPFRTRGLSQLTSSLYIGNAVAANNRYLLTTNRITTVINMSVEIVNTFIENIQYVKVPVTDSSRAPIGNFFDAIADFIHGVELCHGRTLVHCHAGISRSSTVCMAYLMKYHSLSLLDAHTWVKACRPVIRPNNGFWEQLIEYEFKLFARNTVRMIESPMGRLPDTYEKEFQLLMSL